MKYKFGVYILFVSMLFCGCSKGGSPMETDQTSLNQILQEDFSNCEEIELLTRGCLIDSPYTQSIGHGYEIIDHTESGRNIIVYNYSKGTADYLTKVPAFLRGTKEDSGWLPSMSGGCVPVAGKDKLFVFKMSVPGQEKALGSEGKGYILQMNYDGSGKQQLKTIGYHEFFDSTNVAFDGIHMYYLPIFLDSTGKRCGQKLMSLNTDNGKETVLEEYDNTRIHWLVGCWGDGLILQHVKKLSSDNKVSGEAPYAESQITLYQPSSTEEKELITLKSEDFQSVVYEDKLIYLDSENNDIFSMDLKTNTTELLVDTEKINTHEFFEYVVLRSQVFDYHLIFDLAGHGSGRSYALDMENGVIKPVSLEINGSQAAIAAEDEKYFVLYSGKGEKSLILKDDYWAGNPDIVLFKDLTHKQ